MANVAATAGKALVAHFVDVAVQHLGHNQQDAEDWAWDQAHKVVAKVVAAAEEGQRKRPPLESAGGHFLGRGGMH